MSDYTPTTYDVRQAWADSQDMTWDEGPEFHGAEFDRWLASVKAEAWDEGFSDGHYLPNEPLECDCRNNPYREESK